MVRAVKSPRYWREPTEFEVYSLRKGEEAIVSVVNHAQEPAVIAVHLDATALGLDPAKPVYVWLQRMRDNRGAKGWDKSPSQCFEKVYVGKKHVENGELRLSVEARPILLEQWMLTQSPVWFTHLHGETLRTVQNNLLTASMTSHPTAPNAFRVEVERGPARLFFLGTGEGEPSATLDGEPGTVRPATLGNASGFSMEIPGGIHSLVLF